MCTSPKLLKFCYLGNTSQKNRQHWVGKSLIQAWNKIDKSDDVIRFRDVAVRVRNKVEFLHILSIQSEEGKEKISENLKNIGSVRGRPYTEVGEGKYDVPNKILLTKWIPLNKVLSEIEMVKNEDGTSSLSEDSIAKLQLKEKDSLLALERQILMMTTMKWKTF